MAAPISALRAWGPTTSGLPVVLVEFDEEGAERFADLTEELVGQPMAIFVGGN